VNDDGDVLLVPVYNISQRPLSIYVCFQLLLAEKSTDPVTTYIASVVPLLKLTYDDACSRYVELFLEREESDSSADRLSQQTLLVFLVDDTDVMPTHGHQRSHDNGDLSASSATLSLRLVCLVFL